MDIWWPRIKDLGIPVPETVSLPMPSQEKQMDALDNNHNLEEFVIAASKKAMELAPYPLFMRGDATSCKQEWNTTCYVDTQDALDSNIFHLIEGTYMRSMGGETENNTLYFRKFVELEKAGFTSFWHKMPVTKEFRCFIRNGQRQCIHPYWPEDAMENPSVPNWKDLLKKNNTLEPEDAAIITKHLRTVADVFPDYWTVDFAKSESGEWLLLDMARGEVSHHWASCQWAKEFETDMNCNYVPCRNKPTKKHVHAYKFPPDNLSLRRAPGLVFRSVQKGRPARAGNGGHRMIECPKCLEDRGRIKMIYELTTDDYICDNCGHRWPRHICEKCGQQYCKDNCPVAIAKEQQSHIEAVARQYSKLHEVVGILKFFRTCPNCGKKFEVNNTKKKYCSQKCSHKLWQKIHKTGQAKIYKYNNTPERRKYLREYQAKRRAKLRAQK